MQFLYKPFNQITMMYIFLTLIVASSNILFAQSDL